MAGTETPLDGLPGATPHALADSGEARPPPPSEEKYRQLFAALDEGFCIIEVIFDADQEVVDYRFLENNPAFERLSGLSDVVGRNIRALAPSHEQAWFDTFGRIALTGVPERFELRADAMRHWYDVYAFRVGDPAQHHVAIVFSDISERKSTEAALRESERRFRTLAADREQLLEAERTARIEADRATRARDEILATLSHELRTPLASIVTWSRLLQMQFVHDEDMLRKGLTVIGDNAMALGRLISDLLDTSRMMIGKFDLDDAVLDLHALISSVLATLRPAAESKGVMLVCRLEGASPRILADGPRLRQVVLNLVSNAIKFTPEGGRIDVACRQVDGQFLIEVADDGEGIAREFLPTIFNRFTQADAVRDRRRGGLGLGLSIAREIIERHGGSLHAHSDGPGKGSCFTILLPGQLAERAARAPCAMPPEGVPPEALAGMRVLAIEDQADMRELLRRLLAEHGAEVTMADTADEALALLRLGSGKPPFDMLVSDIGLPSMDGNTFMRIVRQELRLDASALPAVAVSAYARQADRERALAAGYQAYMTKPYDVVALISVLRGFRSESTRA